jgi:hypothetical protein
MRPSLKRPSILAFILWRSLIVAAGDAPPGRPIMLPPFLVEESPLFNQTDWQYYQDSGLEILSACPVKETEQFIRDICEQRAALSQFIPDDLLVHTALPTTLILFPISLKKEIDQQMVKEVERIPRASNATGNFGPMNDLRLSDPDSSFIFVILDDWQWGRDNKYGHPDAQRPTLLYTPQYLRYLISSRTPVLPDWFTTGIVRLYETVAFNDASTGRISPAWTAPGIYSDKPWQRTEFQRDPWMSPVSAAALREHAYAPRPLVPMRELFVATIANGKSDTYGRVWEAQAELFARWAFSDRIKDGRVRLQKFAKAAATEPVTEDLFRSCFEMRYSDARDALSDFLPMAVSKGQQFDCAATSFDSKAVDVREATPQEIHRIKGEWARRTLRVVQSNYPGALPLYVAKARSVLQGAYDHGERDPLLLASLALFRLDIGDEKGGRRLLEESPAAGAARPLAALELAQLRMNEALKKPAGISGALSDDQARNVLREVSETIGKQPPIEAAYLLAARVSEHLARSPTDAERASLNEGARLFPRDSQMVMESVSWDLRAHDLASARSLIDLGEYEAADTPTLEKFRLLENLLSIASHSGN